MPKPYGTPGGVGYVDPFAPKQYDTSGTVKDPVDPSVTDPLKEQFNSIVTGLNAYRSTQKPPSEPAVVSSEGAQERVDGAKQKLETMTQKGTSLAEDGSAVYADGSTVPAPQGATYDESTGKYVYDGKTYGAASFYDEHNPDSDYAAVMKLFQPLKASLDADTLGQVNAIEQQFSGLRMMQQDLDKRSEQSLSRSLMLGGSTRYAPATAIGQKLNEASLGLSRIADLDSKENMALAQAKSAQTEGNFKIMTQALDMAEKIRAEKQTHASKIMDSIDAANAELAKQRQEMQRDDAVAQLMASGTTNPAAIIAGLKKQGISMTAADVASAVKNLTPTTTSKTAIYKFTNDDVGKLLGAGMTAPLIQHVQDYYNGVNAEMPNLTPSMQAAVQTALVGKVASGTPEWSTTEKKKLEQAGLLNAPRQDQLDFLYGDTGSGDYDKARKFLEDNPDASREELSSALHENTKLSVSDINALLDEKGAIKETASIEGNEDAIAVALVKSQGFMGDAQAAKDYIDSAKQLDINDKTVKLSARQITAIKAAIDKAYPSGKRSLGQSIFPGGK